MNLPLNPRVEVLIIAASHQRRSDLIGAVKSVGCLVKARASIDSSTRDCKLIILDCEHATEYARQICHTARQTIGRGRILAFTRQRSSMARAALLECGADLVLCEPFAVRELLACVHALTWRDAEEWDRPMAGVGTTIGLEQESLPREPLVGGTPLSDLAKALQLTETERLLLETLAKAKATVATARLHDAVFSDANYAADSSHLRVHMHRLRTKLERAGLGVEGLQGRGYRLISASTR
ncbi:MAG: winged helix-turn-helix domain-containing protein [Polyangiaceae bacterium]